MDKYESFTPHDDNLVHLSDHHIIILFAYFFNIQFFYLFLPKKIFYL